MIEINNLEDLKPFIKYVPAKFVNGASACLNIEISENGELQDVAINCVLDLTFSFDNVFSNLIHIEEMLCGDDMAQCCDIKFIARNIYANKEFVCDYVKCDNLYIEDKVALNFLVVYRSVKGNSLSAKDIMCHTISANYVYTNFLNVVNFKSNELYINDIHLKNVSFHQPDFSEGIIKRWNGVKVNKYELAKDYDTLPF